MQATPIAVEVASLRLAEQSGVPAPHVHAVCDDASFVGAPFFVTSRVEGETIPRRVLRMVEATPGLGATLAHQCGEALARLHAADPSGAHPLVRETAAGDAAAHALRGLEPSLGALLQPSPALRLVLRWLEREKPAPPPRESVLHGDFRNGNLIVNPEGLRACLDWEISRMGDPMEDLGWLCQRTWRFRNDALEVGGFADLAALRGGYEAAGGTWRGESFHWWKVLGTFRWGLGLAGQAAAHLDGSVRSIVMAASGRRVAELEYDALMLVRRDFA